MMERSAIMTTMGELKLFGMRSAYDEIVASAVKRQHEPQRVVNDHPHRGPEISHRQRMVTDDPSGAGCAVA